MRVKSIVGLLCCGFFSHAYAADSERMSARDLYYKLLQQSTNVELDEEAQAEKKQTEAWKKMDRHHKIQRIGPDPKPENDNTLQIPVDPNPLRPPYGPSDLAKEPKSNNTPIDDTGVTGITDPIVGPPDEPEDDPDREPHLPSTPLTAPNDQTINTNNPLIQPEEQIQFQEDMRQPLKTPEERSQDQNPIDIKNNPLNDPTE